MKNLLILLLLPLYSCFNLQKIIGTTLITSSLLTPPVDSVNKYHQQTPVPIVTDNGQFTTSKITTQRNNIYLYGDVTPESCEELKNYITEMDARDVYRIKVNEWHSNVNCFTVSRFDDEKYCSEKHLSCDFCTNEVLYRLESKFPNIMFEEIICDWFWSPSSWFDNKSNIKSFSLFSSVFMERVHCISLRFRKNISLYELSDLPPIYS